MQTVPDPFAWTGKTLANYYEVEAPVADGGFGTVYRARHKVFGDWVAIKALRLKEGLGRAERQDFITQFLAEARVLYRLSRDVEAVVRPLHVDIEASPRGGVPYLVLEWLHGETLASELEARRARRLDPWRLVDAMAVLDPAVEALACAHATKIVHRDLKPSNLFLREGFRRRTAKVLDFGVAKVMTHSAAWTTTTGAVAFTLAYAAPEQLAPKVVGSTGPWTDVYALALVLVEMLSGRPPYTRADIGTVGREAFDRDRRPTPRTHGAVVSDAVERVLARALAVEPSHRFPDAETFWRALRGAAEADPTKSKSAPPAANVRTEPMRRRRT